VRTAAYMDILEDSSTTATQPWAKRGVT